MIRHIAFDFDGTLVRSNAIKRRAFYDATAGIEGAAEVLDALFAAGFRGDRLALMRTVTRRLDGQGASTPDPEQLAATYSRLCRERIAVAPEVPGAQATLDWLARQGARLYLASATPQEALEQVVADRGLDRLFDRLLGAPTAKATHLHRILADSGIGPDGIAMVGDGRDDREAALAVGCRFVAVADRTDALPDGAEPAIGDLSELPPLLGYPPLPGRSLAAGAARP